MSITTVHLTENREPIAGELVHSNPNYLVLVLADGSDKVIAQSDVASIDQQPGR